MEEKVIELLNSINQNLEDLKKKGYEICLMRILFL